MRLPKLFYVTLGSALIAFGISHVILANSSSTSSVGIDQGASRMFVGSGGTLDIETGGILSMNAVTLTPTSTEFNQVHETAQSSNQLGVIHYARWTYDFAVSGGAVGTINLTPQLPAKAVVIGGIIDPATSLLGAAGATVSFGVEAAGDLKAAASVTGYASTGRSSLIPAWTGATSVKTTVARGLSVVIGTAAITQGKANIFVEYYLSQ